MRVLCAALLIVVGLALPASADEWEGWEPKRTLPTEALETLKEQAIPEPEPEPVVQAQPAVTGVERWRPLVEVYGGWDVDRMLRIMWCESRGEPWAKNPYSSATGLFQIMASIWYDGRDLYDPVVNVDVAHHVWTVQGYGAWVCRG